MLLLFIFLFMNKTCKCINSYNSTFGLAEKPTKQKNKQINKYILFL